MDLICWGANTIDQTSTMKGGGEGVTFAVGYVNDVEDVYIFGLMTSGFLLIGTGRTWMYRDLDE